MSQTKAQLLNPLGDFTLPGLLIGVGATFSGNVSIAGTLTKQDVTNVDAVGLITARSGINVTGGNVFIGQGGSGENNAELKLQAGAGTGNDIIAFLNQAGTTKGNLTYDTDNNFLLFNVNESERLRIASDGKVGINKSSPAEALDVTGSIQLSGSVKLDTHPLVSYSSFTEISGGTYAARLGSTGSSTIRSTQIYGGGSHIATFDGVNNRLGIGTDVPDSTLTIDSASNPELTIKTAGTIRTTLTADTGSSFTMLASRDGYPLVFSVSGGGGTTERLRIGTSGQLGIAGANYGTAGQVLASGGSGSAPSWTTISAAPEVEGTASGAITAHKSCIVNTNGTISQVLQTVVPATTTNQDTELTNNGTYFTGDVKWLTSDKFLMLGRKINDSNKARYFFGSVTSGGAITLTNAAMWTGNYQEAWNQRIAVDSSTNKFIALTQLDGDNAIYMRAGEVNGAGTDISWSSGNWWNVGSGQKTSTIATDNNGGYMMAYRNSNDDIEFKHVELDGSGHPNSVSSGASWTYYNTNNGDYANYENQITMEYIPSVGAYWCVIVDSNRFYYSPNGIWLVNHGYFRACWAKSNGTGSAPTLTLANQTIFAGGASNTDPGHAGGMGSDPRLVYDPTSGKGILAYRPNFGSGKGKALVLTFTDTSAQPTYVGSGVEVTQNSCSGLSVTVTTNTNVKKVVFYSSETGNTLVRSFDVSGNTLVGAGNTLNIFPGQHYQNLVVDSNNFDTGKARLITMTQDEGNGEYLSASAIDLPIVNTNLTDENFIGFAADSYADTATAKVKVVGNTSTQSGLTTAQKYYVKWDGTLSTSPDPQGAPSVTAGRALSSTSLLIQPA